MSSELEAALLRYDLAVSAYRAALSGPDAWQAVRDRRAAYEAAALVHQARRLDREAAGHEQ